MQLTKDDVEDYNRGEQTFEEKVLNFSKYQQVRKFYEDYRDCPEMYANHFPDNEWWKLNENKYRKINNTTCSSRDFYEETHKLQKIIDDFNRWLFNYCFVEGLK